MNESSDSDDDNGWNPDPPAPIVRTLGVVLIVGILVLQFVVTLLISVTSNNPDYFPVVMDFGVLLCIGACIRFGGHTLQFSLRALLVGIVTLQIPVALLIMAKSQLQWGLGIVLGLLWGAGVVTYLLVTAKPAIK